MTGPMLEGSDRPRASRPQRLKKRADFVKAAKGARAHARAFALQARQREDESQAAGPRVGFTVTRKTGDAVERNRIRRRLREVLRLNDSLPLRPDHDYVLVARREALSQDFGALRQDLERALQKLNEPHRAGGRRQPRKA